MNAVIAKICCFGSPGVQGKFTQLTKTSSHVKFNARNERAAISEEDGANLTNQNVCLLFLFCDIL